MLFALLHEGVYALHKAVHGEFQKLLANCIIRWLGQQSDII